MKTFEEYLNEDFGPRQIPTKGREIEVEAPRRSSNMKPYARERTMVMSDISKEWGHPVLKIGRVKFDGVAYQMAAWDRKMESWFGWDGKVPPGRKVS